MDVQFGNAPGVQHAGANAVVQGKPTDPQPIDIGCVELRGQVSALERGVGLVLRMRSFVDHNRRFGECEARVEGRAGRLGHAVGRPWATLRLEADMIGRMPVAGGNDGRPGVLGGLDPGIEDRHDGVAVRHGQGTTGTEITLHVDDEQGIRRTQRRQVHATRLSWRLG